MNRRILLTGLCIASVFLLSWRSLLCTQETSGKAKPNSIVGEWIEVSIEKGGIQHILPDYLDVRLGMERYRFGSVEMHKSYVWKISKDRIEEGPDEKDRFPQWRYTYRLNPDDQNGTIDLIPLDAAKGKKKTDKPKKQLAIYFVKDDYLMVCFGRDSRPKSFTSSKDNPNWVYILRRSKLKSADPDSAKPKRKDK